MQDGVHDSCDGVQILVAPQASTTLLITKKFTSITHTEQETEEPT